MSYEYAPLVYITFIINIFWENRVENKKNLQSNFHKVSHNKKEETPLWNLLLNSYRSGFSNRSSTVQPRTRDNL